MKLLNNQFIINVVEHITMLLNFMLYSPPKKIHVVFYEPIDV